MKLELLSNNPEIDLDECNPECLPFEESLDNALKNAKGKTPEELEKQFEEEDKELRERVEEYIESHENNVTNFDNDDEEYSSGETVPTCNPWE